jgi:hypothetical protein
MKARSASHNIAYSKEKEHERSEYLFKKIEPALAPVLFFYKKQVVQIIVILARKLHSSLE